MFDIYVIGFVSFVPAELACFPEKVFQVPSS